MGAALFAIHGATSMHIALQRAATKASILVAILCIEVVQARLSGGMGCCRA